MFGRTPLSLGLVSILVSVLGTLVAGCSSVDVAQRMPAQSSGPTPADPSPQTFKTAGEIQFLVDAMAADFDKNKLPVEVLIRSTIALHAIAQKLSASFDARIEYRLAHPSKAPYVLQSEMDCRIWENYVFAHESEETLLLLQSKVLATRRDDLYRWFVGLFFANRGDTVAQILTKAQLTRALANQHTELCANGGCPDFAKVTDAHARPFDPFDDREMLNFKNKNLSKIAIYSSADFDNPTAGSCYAQSQREPNQASTPVFDWKTHHTWGETLPTGKFTITYDDGPNAK
jgi:hypothetical protein